MTLLHRRMKSLSLPLSRSGKEERAGPEGQVRLRPMDPFSATLLPFPFRVCNLMMQSVCSVPGQ